MPQDFFGCDDPTIYLLDKFHGGEIVIFPARFAQ
jgi:hypothetical protein